MILSRHVVLVLSMAILLSSTLLWAAEPDTTSDAFRQAFVRDFDRSILNTTPGDAMMLRILIESMGAQQGVEVGSATGFGAVNMGIAFERTGGHLFTLDIEPWMVATTQENLAKVGLEGTVTCIEGDALETIPELAGEFDFVFIDAYKPDYFKYFKCLEPKLKPGAVIVADNVIKYGKDMKDFLGYLGKSPDYDIVTIQASQEKGDGMLIAHKIRRDYTKLFNGKNLDGWVIENQGAFSVRNGLLHVNKGTGWLRSSESFSDFVLEMDFRFLEKEANSGIFIRTKSTSKDDEYGWPDNGYQVQCQDIIEDTYPLATMIPYGAPPFKPESDLRALAKAFRKTGQWNHYKITCRGEELSVELNGILITKATEIKNRQGHIGIQAEHGLLEFRAIRIQRLD
jgi:predicted O-methyltransferase YrrM